MKTPTGAIDVLMAEHRQVERVLRALYEVVSIAESSGRPPSQLVLEKIVQFTETFTDGRHHEKEEKILFAEMHAHGYSLESGPIGCMMRQHESGRALITTLRRWTEADAALRERHADIAIQSASRYVELLSSHISVEDSALFPSVLANLPGSALRKIEAAYRAVDPPTWLQDMTAAADEIALLLTTERASRDGARP